MPTEVQILAIQIKQLVDRLVEITEGGTESKTPLKMIATPPLIKGASGAVKSLIDEGFLSEPKDLMTIMDKLKEIGHYHQPTTVSMNLLNLTKKRVLNRIKNSETKNWQYVIRK